MTPREQEILQRQADARAHAIPGALLSEFYANDVEYLLRRCHTAEGMADDWARSVMCAAAGVVGTPEEGFVKAPYTLHRAVMELREACVNAQGEKAALERQLAEAQAREAELRRALADAELKMSYPELNTPGLYQKVAAALALPADRTALDRAIAEAVAAEREACVEACVNEQVDGDPDSESDEAYNRACDDCAAAIRERGKG